MESLTDKEIIEKIFKEGKKIYTSSLKAVYIPSDKTQILISAPIKIFKRAVDRNRIKRLIRESIRGKNIGNWSIAIIYNIRVIKPIVDINNDVDIILRNLK